MSIDANPQQQEAASPQSVVVPSFSRPLSRNAPVYLIRHELPKESAAAFRWTLVAIKTMGASCTGATYVAFDTEVEAAEFAGTLNAAFCYSVIRNDQIGLSTYIQPDSCMLVFASAGDLKARRELGDLGQGRFLKLESPRGVASFVRRAKNWMAVRMNRGGSV